MPQRDSACDVRAVCETCVCSKEEPHAGLKCGSGVQGTPTKATLKGLCPRGAVTPANRVKRRLRGRAPRKPACPGGAPGPAPGPQRGTYLQEASGYGPVL